MDFVGENLSLFVLTILLLENVWHVRIGIILLRENAKKLVRVALVTSMMGAAPHVLRLIC